MQNTHESAKDEESSINDQGQNRRNEKSRPGADVRHADSRKRRAVGVTGLGRVLFGPINVDPPNEGIMGDDADEPKHQDVR